MKAAIFDLDGTLVESLPGLTEALNLLLDDLGRERLSPETVRGFIGDGLWYLIRRALPEEEYNAETITTLQDDFQKHYALVWREGTEIYDGVPELLATLKEKGVQLGVLSNKKHPFTVEIVEALFGRDLIPLIYGQRDDIPKKPDPTALISICDEIKVSAEDVVYIGDSTVDLETAVGAKTKGIGVSWGYHDKERLTEYGLPLCDSVAELQVLLLGM